MNLTRLNFRSFRLGLATVLAGTLMAFAGRADAATREREKPLPRFANVKVVLLQHFAKLAEESDYKPGDLIVREQVAPTFKAIKKLGWNVADRTAILRRVHDEDDLLAQQLLGSEKGVKFMRAISKFPLGFDRVERLNRLPLGKQTVHDLIHKVGGAEMIRYMTTAKGGTALGQMLSHDPGGKNFNKPTGYIYTQQQLVEALERSYEAEKRRRANGTSPNSARPAAIELPAQCDAPGCNQPRRD